jgi:predicted ester cyclase
MTSAAFPDLHFTIEDLIAEGDKIVYRYSATGTHKGNLNGIEATGKPVTITGMVISRIVNGKVQEDWEQTDMLGLMQQLGVVPKLA